MNTIAIYPGTFDPVTNGHIDLVSRSLPLFSKVIVAIAENVRKATVLSLEQRLELLKEVLPKSENIVVCAFSGLLVDFARQQKAKVILRGLRAVSDFEYELQMGQMNRHLHADIETLFLAPSEKYSYLSSSLVREVASLGGNISDFVHPKVKALLQKIYR